MDDMKRSRLGRGHGSKKMNRLKPEERDFKIILPVAEQTIVDEASKKMSKRFGGVTMLPIVRGIWVDKTGKLIKDDNIMLFSSRDLDKVSNPERMLEQDRVFMDGLAREFGRKLKQDEIWTEEDMVNIEMVKP
jgi:hypothetical protein